MTEPPVVALVGFKPLRRVLYGLGRRNNHPVLNKTVVGPVRRDRYIVFIRHLEGLSRADKFADVAANLLGIANHKPYEETRDWEGEVALERKSVMYNFALDPSS